METNSNIPKYLIDVMNSQQLFDLINEIEAEFNLHIDQTGDLYVLICDTLLKKEKSSEFVKNVIERVAVKPDVATKITERVNQKIFSTIKLFVPQGTVDSSESVTSIEQAGGFNIENQTETTITPETVETHSDILSGIENPQPGSEKISRKESSLLGQYKEPLVDQLLNGSVAQPQQKTVQQPVQTQVPQNPIQNTPKSAPPVNRPGPDPYREGI